MVYTDNIHLVATTLNELHSFAELIELNRCYFHNRKKKQPHYDLWIGQGNANKRHRAIDAGAILVSSREIVIMFQSGKLEKIGKPMKPLGA